MIPTVVIPIIDNHRREHYEYLSRRAVASVERQTLITPYLVSYGDTLEDAKNNGVNKVTTESVMILDADDFIDPLFMAAVDKVEDWDIIKPRVFLNGLLNAFPEYDIKLYNYLINGCPVKTELWHSVGGAQPVPYQDWWLWARIVIKHDPKIVYCRDAVYHYIKTQDGVNNTHTEDDMRTLYSAIADYAVEHAR